MASDVKTTPLHKLHLEKGAKMVEFAGYQMPVQYPLGVKGEHLHTREKAGLFDVSHMGQLLISAEGITHKLEKLVPVDLEALQVNQQTYAVLTNEEGGILDDLIITRWHEEQFFVVVNAACKTNDIAHLRQHLPGTSIVVLDNQALLALQGPMAKQVMAELAPQACELTFMHGAAVSINAGHCSIDCYITRSGYTGEDGFEISVSTADAEILARHLLSFEEVELIGLGARDSLRLEAGLCLYGHELTPDTTPIDASLLWSISKSRRPEANKAGGFLGATVIFDQIASGTFNKRVGLKVDGRIPVREGAVIVDDLDKQVGVVTSGTFSPSLETPVAMAYVEKSLSALGTQLFAVVRNKKIPVVISKMPFVEQRYYRD